MSDPLLQAQRSGGNGNTTIRAFDRVQINRLGAAGTNLAFRVFDASQVKTCQRITGAIVSGLLGGARCCGASPFRRRNADSFATLFAFYNFTGRLIGQIQNCFAGLAANFDRHVCLLKSRGT